jgi:HEAT repeat protein
MGIAASVAIADLDALAKGSDKLLQTIVAWAKLRIEPANKATVEQALPLLIAELGHPAAFVREEIAEALGLAGGLATRAIPALTDRLVDAEPRVRHAALVAIAQIGPPASAATSIAARLQDDAEPVRRSATFALGRIGPAANKYVSQLSGNLVAEDELLRVVTAWALLRIDPENAKYNSQCQQLLRQAAAQSDAAPPSARSKT